MAKAKIGTITKLDDGKYRIRVQRGRKPNGTPYVKSETFYGNAEQASIRAARIAQSMGRPAAYSDLTLKNYYYEVFKNSPSIRGTPRSKRTLTDYEGAMKAYILPTLGELPIASITHAQMRQCVLDAGSPNNAKKALRAVMRAAFDDELVPEKAFERRVPTPVKKRKQQQPWSRYEAQNALERVRGYNNDLELYMILGLSGLRMAEALALRPCDVELQSTYSFATGKTIETLTAHIRGDYTDIGGLSYTKNEYSERVVPILYTHRARLTELLIGRDPNERILNITGNYLYMHWRKMCERLELRFIPPSMMRHTSDTLALTAGVSSDLNDKMHGRTEHGTTYAHYYRPDLGLMEEASRKIGDVLSNPT